MRVGTPASTQLSHELFCHRQEYQGLSLRDAVGTKTPPSCPAPTRLETRRFLLMQSLRVFVLWLEAYRGKKDLSLSPELSTTEKTL